MRINPKFYLPFNKIPSNAYKIYAYIITQVSLHNQSLPHTSHSAPQRDPIPNLNPSNLLLLPFHNLPNRHTDPHHGYSNPPNSYLHGNLCLYYVESWAYSKYFISVMLSVGLNKLSILITNNPAISSEKYLLVSPLTSNGNGFTSRWTIFTSNTFLYETVLQYLVYNKLDTFVQAMQLTSMIYPLSSTICLYP